MDIWGRLCFSTGGLHSLFFCYHHCLSKSFYYYYYTLFIFYLWAFFMVFAKDSSRYLRLYYIYMHTMIKSQLVPKDLRETTVSSTVLHLRLLLISQEEAACNFSLVHSLGTYPHFSKWHKRTRIDCYFLIFQFQVSSIDSPLPKMSI